MAENVAIPLSVPDLSPDCLPARASLPFPRGILSDVRGLRVLDGRGSPIPSQARSLLAWPDGSCKQALVIFDARGATGPFRAVTQDGGTADDRSSVIARVSDGGVSINTGKIAFRVHESPLNVDERDGGILTGITWGSVSVTGRALDGGFVVTESDGSVYSSQKAGPGLAPARWQELHGAHPPLPSFGISLVEEGPVRAVVRIEGRTARDAYRGGLDYIASIEVFRDRSIVRLSLSWLHRDPAEARFVRDMVFRVPLAAAVAEAWFGTEKGPCHVTVRPGRRWTLVQKSAALFEAARTDWDGRRFDVASGAANGASGPGWVQVRSVDGRVLSAFVPGFSEEHPNGIAFTRDALDILLWPHEAASALQSARILPPLLDGAPEQRHRKLAYECLAHHPYEAFFDPETGCLETVQGMQKTRDIVFDCDPSIDAPTWARSCASGALEMPTAWPARSPAPSPADRALAAAADWFANYSRLFGVSGAFNRGDLFYLIHDDLDTEPWRQVLEQHARSGYWNNNEEDPVHGMFIYARRVCSPEHQRTAEIMARHLWDIDVRHHPPWGVHTHTEGHCFRSQTWSGTDHFWLEGLLDYYLATGIPDVRDGVREIARVAARALEDLVPAETDLRTIALAIAQALRCAEVLDDPGLAEHARLLALAQAADVTEHGFFSDYGSRTGNARSPSLLFGTLFVEALGELLPTATEPVLMRAGLRQVDWFLSHAVRPDGRVTDPADTWATTLMPDAASEDQVGGLQLLACLGHAWRWTGDGRYAAAGKAILERFCRTFRPPQSGEGLGQIRPLVPATALRCVPIFLEALEATAP